MLLGEEYIKRPDGLIVTRSHYNFDHVWEANYELSKEIGDGFTQSRELRHTLRIPGELADCDPLVAAASEGDKVCMRLAVARYPRLKVCSGNL
jgi:hypothetical protein